LKTENSYTVKRETWIPDFYWFCTHLWQFHQNFVRKVLYIPGIHIFVFDRIPHLYIQTELSWLLGISGTRASHLTSTYRTKIWSLSPVIGWFIVHVYKLMLWVVHFACSWVYYNDDKQYLGIWSVFTLYVLLWFLVPVNVL